MIYIYTLKDPISNEIRYIGKTNNIERRFQKHITEKRNNTYKEQWISGLKNKGYLPIIEIIDTVPKEDWIFWETWWISLFKSWNFKLTNISIGGEGGPLSEETKNKIRLSKIGSKGRLGTKNTEESKLRMSIDRKGKKQTKEHIESRSKSCIKEIDIEKLKNEYDKNQSYEYLSKIFNLSKSKIYRTLKSNNLLKYRKVTTKE
jgi:hypothetical protein